MSTITAYRRDNDGTLTQVDVPVIDGEPHGLTRTDETVELQGWPDSHARVWETDGGVEVLVSEDAADEEDRGDYVVLYDDDHWGEGFLPDRVDAMAELCDDWLDNHAPHGVSVELRRVRSGQIAGTYLLQANGNLQILGGSIQVSEAVRHLLTRAWDYAYSTLDDE